MEILELLLVFGLLYKTIDAGKIEVTKNVSFSVNAIWLGSHKKNCTCPAPWAEGVQKYYTGVREAVDGVFKHEKAKKMGDCAVTTLQKLIDKLMYLSNSNSTDVKRCSIAILSSLSTCSQLGESSLNIIVEFDKVLNPIIDNFNNVAKSLCPHLGELACKFTTDLTDVGRAFSKYHKDFIRSSRLFQCKMKVDSESVLKKLYRLFSTLALINDSLLNKCGCKATQAVYESVMILDLMYTFIALAVTGISSCAIDHTYSRGSEVSENFKLASLSFEDALVGIANSVVSITFPLEKSIPQLLAGFVEIAATLYAAVRPILGLVGNVGLTIADVTKNLLQVVL